MKRKVDDCVFWKVIEVPLVSYGIAKEKDHEVMKSTLETIALYYQGWLYAQGLEIEYEISYDVCGSFGGVDPMLMLNSYHLTIGGYKDDTKGEK